MRLCIDQPNCTQIGTLKAELWRHIGFLKMATTASEICFRFRSWRRHLLKIEIYLQTKFRRDISIHGWDNYRLRKCFVLTTGRGVSACGSGRPLQLTASAGTIKSPGYADGTYPNNADCQWLITAPPGNVRMVNILTQDTYTADNSLDLFSTADCSAVLTTRFSLWWSK